MYKTRVGSATVVLSRWGTHLEQGLEKVECPNLQVIGYSGVGLHY